MFLERKYILSNELVEKMGIHIANISMLRNSFEQNDDYYSIVKMNNCSFINTKAKNLPRNIRDGISSNTFTDMSDKLPCTYTRTEYEVTEKELFRAGIVIDKVRVCGKDLYVFDHEFIKKMKGCIGYVLDEEETLQCFRNKEIIGYIKLAKNKYWVWY